jgi:hypothetical protein
MSDLTDDALGRQGRMGMLPGGWAKAHLEEIIAMRDEIRRHRAAQTSAGDCGLDDVRRSAIAALRNGTTLAEVAATLVGADEDAQTASADRVRTVVREATADVIAAGTWTMDGTVIDMARLFRVEGVANAIADRVAAQLTARPPGPVCRNCGAPTGCDCYDRAQELLRVERDRSASWELRCDSALGKVATLERRVEEGPPGHVCPAQCALGPEELELLEWLRKLTSACDRRVRAVLDRIIAMHRATNS